MSDLTPEKTAQALRHLARHHREECEGVNAISADQLDEWATEIDGLPPLEPRVHRLPTSAERMEDLLRHDPLCIVRAEMKVMKDGGMMFVTSAPFDKGVEKAMATLMLIQLQTVMPRMFGLNDKQREALQAADQVLQGSGGNVEADALRDAFGLPKDAE